MFMRVGGWGAGRREQAPVDECRNRPTSEGAARGYRRPYPIWRNEKEKKKTVREVRGGRLTDETKAELTKDCLCALEIVIDLIQFVS